MAHPHDTRPDPDQLLEKLRGAEVRAQRGKLRIYFGASAGVGKTNAMLAAAQRARQLGTDVLVGLVETHGRSDTAELLAGLPQLPLKDITYRGRTLKEFDLDAALARQPAVLLVDELAHSNVDGSRHPKRWHDVEELLAAGIDVWSSLNVQHLESLNGTVGAITGIRVHETVPDTVLDGADEVILVDVTPDELISRLKAGKVYLPQQAERAAQNFFRKGNLIALREIALRRTAEHVEDDVRSYRVEHSGAAHTAAGALPVWNTSGAILACIGPEPGAEQTVRSAARLAGQLNVRWHAAYVETPKLQRLGRPERDRILTVIQLAEELGADTAVLAGADAAAELVAQAQALNCATLVVGRPRLRPGVLPALLPAWLGGGLTMTRRLAILSPAVDIVEVGLSQSMRRLGSAIANGSNGPAEGAPARRADAAGNDTTWWGRSWGYAWAVVVSICMTALATPLVRVLDLANIVMLFLLGVVLVAMRFGRGPAALAAFLNVAAFDFFFVAPQLSFSVGDAQYLVTFVVMLGVGLLIGQLTAGLRFQARISSSRERRAQSLFELTRDLSAALMHSQVAELGAAAVQRNFGGQALVLVTEADDRLALPAVPPPGFDASVADWSLRNAQPAGLATSTLSAQTWHYVPLKAPMRLRGVLALQPAQARWLLIPEQVQQLDTLARQIAIALERVHYVEVAQQAVVEIESERLRNALLAAISHDVRTPLTALIGLAEGLQRSLPPLAADQADMAQAMGREAHELAALVTNLLDMARLQNGGVHLRSDWQSVEEVVGVAIRAAQHALGDVRVQTHIPADLPLVEFDAVLMERVIVNLLENAAKYGLGDPPRPIEIHAQATPDTLVIAVRDHGPGLPAALLGREATLFDKFTRGAVESATPGVGLGLAICKAVVDAHQGRISAANAEGGGAEFTITLPRRAPPEAIDDI
ncbi:MAG: two-component system sensor histidine kinase KdbD [Rhodoferax sp.]|nr:two-component system sensor histidine kinase KdbD [Rhodoferax sp.]